MARKGARYAPEQIVRILSQANVMLERGLTIEQACKELGISPASYYKWRGQYAGITQQAAKDLSKLKRENARLKQLVADQALRMQILEDGLRGKF
jgi:transposase-like protein